MDNFEEELERLINKHSMENESNTPDWILAQYLLSCLSAFTRATQQRETWYGHASRPFSQEEIKICPKCLGQGRLSNKKGSKADYTYGYIDTCLECNGTGRVK